MNTEAKNLLLDSPGSVSLDQVDPDDTGGLDKNEALEELGSLQMRLGELQELLYAARQHSVLVVLQGMDTSGKDGTVKHVMADVDPAGCQVAYFSVPTSEEVAHDFLWRVHKRTPARGMLAIFNRSHYEDVLVARVHKLVPAEVWEARYEQINNFEHLLAQNDTILLKFFLHISKKEQESRLLAREQDSTKGWKLAVSDWKERRFWQAYQEAYEAALGRCARPWAPWHIVPANKKWYRNVVIARAIVKRLEAYQETWSRDLEKESRKAREELQAYRDRAKPAHDRTGSSEA
jgi:PPK2 family polyphosphate:nucleotide phosphotransferase